MAGPDVMFQARVSGLTLEIASGGAGDDDGLLGHVIYPFPDPMFERGGMNVALLVVTTLCGWLREGEELDALFFADASIAVDPDGGHEAATAALARELERARATGREGEVGAFDRIAGVWFRADRGLALIADLAHRFEHVVAEATEVRLLLLASEADDAGGWDITHRDGITSIGRWNGNLSDGAPGALEPGDVRPLAALFQRLVVELIPALLRGRIEA